ncbi:MAG TPA: BamA/TamA family outer membrane protein [Gemmatimonadales bacterium]|nr:BamA/TamA family outer membrane protein [Gemmatimonadales bacterium]
MKTVTAGARSLALLAVFASSPSRLVAQDSATVIADPAIGRGGLRRFLLGDHYRDLWTLPLRVPVLDLATEAGGLTPVRRGGGLQTKSLRLHGGDGREYVFRLMLKDATNVVPPELRETLAEDIVRDQMSAMHPGAALVAPPILEAAGVLHVTPRFFQMPDDPRLGEFRAEFGNQFGMLEERPTGGGEDRPGFAGAEAVLDTDELIKDLWDRPWVKVDARAYLTARLLDLYFGDWDRHEDQWRWARMGDGQDRYLPIPRDRDQAFVRYDGVLLGVARQTAPQLLVFDDEYAEPLAATWNGRNLDRRLLVELEREVWDSTARELQRVITDSVIDTAVNRLPPEYRARNGEWLRDRLIRRRDELPEAALRTYRFLARNIRLQAGDRADHAVVERLADGRTDVKLMRARGDGYFHRVFHPDETGEIQLDLRDGDDRLLIRGEGGGPLLRVIGGGGADTLIDSSSTRRSRFYDSGDATVAIGQQVDRRPYLQPSDTNPAALPERDWGSRKLGMPLITASPDIGLTFGYSWTRWGYGFRRQPYATFLQVTPEYSLGRNHGRLAFEARWRAVNRDRYTTLAGLASGIEVLHFYGFGNDTRDTTERSFYRVQTEAYQLNPGIAFGLDSRSRLRLGIMARHTVTDPDDEHNRVGPISEVQPLGMGDFGQLGALAVYEWDTRDYPQLPTRGLRFHLEAAYYPVTWSRGEDGFGTIDGVATTFLSPGGQEWLTFALRAGGRHTYGDVPYFERAYLGGRENLRGYPRNRFAGESSAFGAVEARVRLTRAFLIVPGEIGVMGLADVGRVFVDDATDSGEWHADAGGGLYFSALRRTAVVSLGVAQGDEGARFYLGLGLGY